MKLSRREFMRHFGDQRVSVRDLRNDRNLDRSQARRLAPADLNNDGFIQGDREMHQLVSQMANASGSENLSEINVNGRVSSLQGLIRDVAGRPGTNGREQTPSRPTTTTTTRPTNTTQVDNRRREQLIGQLMRAGGSATREDVSVLANELRKMPTAALERMADRGVSVVAARGSVTDHMPELRGVRPRGYPPGRTWDNVAGAYNSGTREAVIATTDRNGRRALGRSGSANVVLHEAGHAYDHAMGRPSNNDSSFVAAREQDLDRLARMNSYYMQPGDAGRSETYAETMAMYLENPGRMQRQLPNLYNYWAQQFPRQ